MEPIDLRSDTLTRPCPDMTRAMARADLGDDCYGESRTVRELEEHVAGLLGHEAGVFMPSGTMSNQIALRCLVERGQEVVCDSSYHLSFFEAAPSGELAGVSVHPVTTPDGLLTPAVLEAARDARARWGPTYAAMSLVWTENTISGRAGRIYPYDVLARTSRWAHEAGVPVYLDGARLLNAVVATGVEPQHWGRLVDMLAVCFAKGLGAPTGSVLAGPADAIARARRYRKWYGGALHQSGPLAAAALWAMQHHVERLAEDHEAARRFAAVLADHGVTVVEPPETNMVLLDVGDRACTPEGFVAALAERGVQVLVWSGTVLRAVFGLGVTPARAEAAAHVLGGLAREIPRRPWPARDGGRVAG